MRLFDVVGTLLFSGGALFSVGCGGSKAKGITYLPDGAVAGDTGVAGDGGATSDSGGPSDGSSPPPSTGIVVTVIPDGTKDAQGLLSAIQGAKVAVHV